MIVTKTSQKTKIYQIVAIKIFSQITKFSYITLLNFKLVIKLKNQLLLVTKSNVRVRKIIFCTVDFTEFHFKCVTFTVSAFSRLH